MKNSKSCEDCASFDIECRQIDSNGKPCDFFADTEEDRIGMHAAKYAESYIDRDGNYHQLYWGERE